MASLISQIVANLESGGGSQAWLNQQLNPTMVDPTYGQYQGFATQYGSGAAGVDNYAAQFLAAHPNATLGDFYSSYVLGTGNVNNPASLSQLQIQQPGAYNNLANNAGYPASTPLSQLVGTGSPTASAAGPNATPTTAGTSSGNPLTDWINSLEGWLGGIAGNVAFVIIGFVLLLGALWIFAANEGASVANSPAGRAVGKLAAGAVEA